MAEQSRDDRIARALIGYPPLLAACLLRSTVVWAAIRIFGLLSGADFTGAGAAIGLALTVGAIVLLDAKATRELLYIRNLSLPPAWPFLWAAGLILVLESVVQSVW